MDVAAVSTVLHIVKNYWKEKEYYSHPGILDQRWKQTCRTPDLREPSRNRDPVDSEL